MATQQANKAQEKISSKQKKINEGQREINGALCYVDWHVIKGFQALCDALEDAGVLTYKQLKYVREELGMAYYTSERVAEIDPPGCGQNFRREEDDPKVSKAA